MDEALASKFGRIFVDGVHVSNHWVPVHALAYTPVPNYDMP